MDTIEINAGDVAAMLQGYAHNIVDGLKSPATVDADVLVSHVKRMLTHAETLAAMMKQMKAANANGASVAAE